MRNKNIEIVSRRIEYLKDLRDSIDNSHSCIRGFIKLSYGRDYIQTLNLSDLNLTSKDLKKLIPLIQEAIPNLERLDLSNNELTTLTKSIENLRSLKVLKLSDNQIANLPENLGNLINLNNLILDNNALTSLPKSIINLIYLNNLSAENNQIARVSEETIKFVKHHKLNLSKNPLCLGTLISIAASAYSENQLCLGDNRAIYDQLFSNA